MPSAAAAPRAAVPLSPARAEASRRNGARSRGPKTPEGKERSAQNALRHGLRARKCVVMPSEDAAEFAALEAALMEELAPGPVGERGPNPSLPWRPRRRAPDRARAAGRRSELAPCARRALGRRNGVGAPFPNPAAKEADLFAHNHLAGRGLGIALIRDCNGARSFDTLLRYRGGTLAELWRALRTLKALQAERREVQEVAPAPAPRLLAESHETPIEPKSRENPGDSARPGDRADLADTDPDPAPTRLPHRPPATAGESASCLQPIGVERREQPAKAGPSLPTEIVEQGGSAASLLAGTALVPLGRR